MTANPTTGMEKARNREAIENALYAFGTLRVALTRESIGRQKFASIGKAKWQQLIATACSNVKASLGEFEQSDNAERGKLLREVLNLAAAGPSQNVERELAVKKGEVESLQKEVENERTRANRAEKEMERQTEEMEVERDQIHWFLPS